MTKEAVLYNFWSSFDIPAYEENSVYTMAEQGVAPTFPYITYEVSTGSFGAVIPLTATAWYRSTSWTAANAKKAEIAKAFENGGIYFLCDGGYVRMFRDTEGKFADNTGDDSDDMVKKIIMQYYAEFVTEY